MLDDVVVVARGWVTVRVEVMREPPPWPPGAPVEPEPAVVGNEKLPDALETVTVTVAVDETLVTVVVLPPAAPPTMWKGKEYWKVLGSESSVILMP